MRAAANPFESPRTPLDPVPLLDEDEALRRDHLDHEASLRAVGMLWLFAALINVSGALGALVNAIKADADPRLLGVATVLVALAGIFGWAGVSLRHLDPRARVPSAILAAIGLPIIPVGTMMSLYLLYLFLSVKGRTVLSADYRGVIERTPDLRYRTSGVIWVFGAGVVALFAMAMLLPMLAG